MFHVKHSLFFVMILGSKVILFPTDTTESIRSQAALADLETLYNGFFLGFPACRGYVLLVLFTF